MAGEKTESATSKRRQDERKKGNIFMSKEVVTIATMLTSFYGFKSLAPNTFEVMQTFLEKYLTIGAIQKQFTPEDAPKIFVDALTAFAVSTLPLIFLTAVISVAITMAQTKMLFSTKAYSFKASKMNPISGLKRMVSIRGIVELIKSILKIILLIYIVYFVLKDEIFLFPRMMDMSPLKAMIYTGDIIMTIALRVGIFFVFLAAADYFYQWWEYEKNLRMSKQEIKDEYKQLEGDPQIKGKVRNLQQQMARKRMMQNVPDADVVIRNPTHYAIAIKYDTEMHNAPVVVAKGADSLALRIIALAEENGVFITENRPLARALFETVDLDREIPTEYYQAIAEVLAFVYSLKKKEMK